MSDTKRLFVKPQYPVHVFEARQGEWPTIGPEWTELTAEQLTAATAGARECSVELKVLEVGSAEELLEQLRQHGELAPEQPMITPEVVRVAPPSQNARTEEWLRYATVDRGLEVHEGASRGDIQAIVAAADQPRIEQNEEE
jgi:hypothetical protein